MATLRELRKQAREKGIEGYRSMSLEDLQTALSANGKPKRKSVSKRKPSGRKSGTSPAKSKAKRTAKASTKTTKTKKKVDGRTTRTRMKVGSRENEADAGKYFIQKLKFTGYDKEVWNPRPDSITGIVFASAKKHKGDREAVYAELKTGWNKAPLNLHKKRDGERRTKDEALKYLGYAISRTLWDFAIKTGQHEKSDNRIEYGTGPNADVRKKKPARKRKAKAKK